MQANQHTQNGRNENSMREANPKSDTAGKKTRKQDTDTRQAAGNARDDLVQDRENRDARQAVRDQNPAQDRGNRH